jgi:hypothetical protein
MPLRGVAMHSVYEAVQIPFARQLVGGTARSLRTTPCPARHALLDALVGPEAALRPLGA